MLYILENILKEHDMLVIYTVLFIYIYIISVLETILFFSKMFKLCDFLVFIDW